MAVPVPAVDAIASGVFLSHDPPPPLVAVGAKLDHTACALEGPIQDVAAMARCRISSLPQNHVFVIIVSILGFHRNRSTTKCVPGASPIVPKANNLVPGSLRPR